MDVAVASFGSAGRDSQNDDAARGSFADGVLHRDGEGDLVNDGLVSRGDDQNRVGAVLLCGQRSQGECGCCVTPHRFQESSTQFDAYFAQLLGSQKAVFFASDDKGLGHLNIVRTYGYQALRGLLEEAFVPGKAQELLGKTCSA